MLTSLRISRTLGRVIRDPWSRPLARFTRRFYRSFVVLERNLRLPLPEIAVGGAIEWGTLERSAIAEYLEYQPERRREFIERRLAAGDTCFTARHAGSLASSIWACRSQRWVEALRDIWRVAPGEVYLYDSYTAPAHRGRGLNPSLCLQALAHFRDQGLERATLITEAGNAANLRAKQKVGFRPSGRIRSFELRSATPIRKRSRFPAPASPS